MLYRRCAAGHDIAIYFGIILVAAVHAARKDPDKYFVVWANNAIVLETDSAEDAEAAYVAECNKEHASGGRFVIGTHKLENGVVSVI